MKGQSSVLLVTAFASLLTAVNPAFAQAWAPTRAPIKNWSGLASSADGNKLVAVADGGGIYVSKNYGLSWDLTSAPVEGWEAVASSANGRKLVAVGNGGIYTSSNEGCNWILGDLPPGYFWVSVTSSSDGSKLAAVDFYDTLAYISTNSGATWISNSIANSDNYQTFGFSRSIAGSADGSKLVVATLGGTIFTSTNSGADWIATSAPVGNWSSVASSVDGDRLVACDALGGGIYVSKDFGINWELTDAPSNNWYSVACSTDGRKLVAVAGGLPPDIGPIFTSVDSGATWVRAPVPDRSWYSVTASADGNNLVAAVLGGSIYIGHPRMHPTNRRVHLQFN